MKEQNSLELSQIEDAAFCMHCRFASVGAHQGVTMIFCAKQVGNCDNHRRADEPVRVPIDIRKLPVWK